METTENFRVMFAACPTHAADALAIVCDEYVNSFDVPPADDVAVVAVAFMNSSQA